CGKGRELALLELPDTLGKSQGDRSRGVLIRGGNCLVGHAVDSDSALHWRRALLRNRRKWRAKSDATVRMLKSFTEGRTDSVTPPPPDPDSLLAAVREFVAEDVLPNVADWDRDDRLPDEAFR